MEIKLGGAKGGVTIVSEEDYEELSKYKWQQTKHGYARAHIGSLSVLMHRYIMNTTDEKKVVDHINNNRLDNRRQNLRITTRLINSQNTKIHADKKSSIYRGVFYSKKSKKYIVKMVVNRKTINIGSHISEIKAAEIFDMYQVHIKKDCTKLNFPDKLENYRNEEYIPHKNIIHKTSKYIGVAYQNNIFRAEIRVNGKRIDLKKSKNQVECALAYDKYIVDNNIGNKTLNFPKNHPNYDPKSIIKMKYKETDNINIIQLVINNKPDVIVLIDEIDYDKIKYHTWNIRTGGYVVGYIGKRGNIELASLSRFLLNVTDPTIFVDHIDGNILNNCRNNLRLSDQLKNSRNKSKSSKKTTSIYLGVYLCKNSKKWEAIIGHNYEANYITRCHSEIEAARAHDLYILIHYPEEHFKLNFKWNPGDIEKWKAKLTTPKNAHKWVPKSPEEKILEKTSRIVQNLSSGNDLMVEKLLSLEKRNSKFKAMEQFNWLNSHNTPKQSTLERSARIATLLSNDDLLEVEKLLLVQKENTKSYLKKLIF